MAIRFAPVALSSDPVSPCLFGETASKLFVAFDSNLDEIWQKATEFLVYTKAKVSPDDNVVYFIEQNGVVQSVNAARGQENYALRIGQPPVTATFALTPSGGSLMFADEAGNAHSIKVSEVSTAALVTSSHLLLSHQSRLLLLPVFLIQMEPLSLR